MFLHGVFCFQRGLSSARISSVFGVNQEADGIIDGEQNGDSSLEEFMHLMHRAWGLHLTT